MGVTAERPSKLALQGRRARTSASHLGVFTTVCRGSAPKYPSVVGAIDFDRLIDKLRRLSPDGLARVEALVERLEPESANGADRFRSLSGTLSEEDAVLMERAAEDCERIDASGW